MFGLLLVLQERTIEGTGFPIVDDYEAGFRRFVDVVIPLKRTLDRQTYVDFGSYDGRSPDTFVIWGSYEPVYGFPRYRAEPPNVVRSAIWELRFKNSSNNPGLVQFDTVRFHPTYASYFGVFRDGQAVDIPVNFLKSIITIAPPPKGDLNWDFELRPSDLVLILNCVTLRVPPPAGNASCDLNCDGEGSAADVVLMIRGVFLKEEFPC